MGFLSPWHILIIAIVGVLLFGGRDRLSGLMGDAAKGIQAFRRGLKEGDEGATDADQPPQLTDAGRTETKDAPVATKAADR